jgi:hypothetical protein
VAPTPDGCRSPRRSSLFNDMCLFAPATLIDPAMEWEPVDAQKVRATCIDVGWYLLQRLS